jgi:transcription termination factor Rho
LYNSALAMSASELSELHLADLHERAAKAGITGFRKLRREELIELLAGDDGDDGDVRESKDARTDDEPRPRRRRGRRGGRGRGGRQRERLDSEEGGRERRPRRERGERDDRDEEPAATEEVTGILEMTRQRHGFLRLGGLTARDDDVYVSASQVRRCDMRPGDEVAGPAREPRRGERHRALVHVDKVNGGEPQEEGRVDFDELTPAPPERRLALGPGAGVLARAVDLLAPLAYGQRMLIRAAPRSGRTTLLRDLGKAIAAGGDARLIVLLIDERPEEVPAWERALPESELALAPADLAPVEQVRIAELALERGRRIAEAGGDAVVICDSLSRLAVAADGVDEVKRLFGSGRELAEDDAGSLTVIATVLAEGEDEGSADRAVATTETSLVTLDPSLAEQGIEPAIKVADSRAVGEESLRSEEEMEEIRRLRSELANATPPEAAAALRERLG